MACQKQSSPFMPPIHNILLFGDLTYDYRKELLQLLHVKNCASLLDFFARLPSALQDELALVSEREQQWLPKSTNLVEMVENMDTLTGSPVVKFTLLCVYQLGRFLNRFGKPTAVFPTDSLLVGLCTGSFAAAAVATSSCVADVVTAGVEAVIYAFRTALHSFRLAKDMETTSALQSWSTVVTLPNNEATDLIQQYVSDKRIPMRHRPFISAVSNSTLTISGPPAVRSEFLKTANIQPHILSIQSPFHASHLFVDEDVDEVLARNMNEIARVSKVRLPYLSSAGVLIEDSDFESIIRCAVQDTLREQIRLDKIVAVCAGLEFNPEITVLPCASTAAAHFTTHLNECQKSNATIDTILESPILPQTSNGSSQLGDSRIAVVGFSGRFPDAASNEELWELLHAGIDTHRTIPEDRFDWKAHYDPSGATRNTSRVKYGCFVKDPGHFDARFFRMSPTEAKDTDPAQRLALMTTHEALEMAGFVPDRTPSSQRDRVGVFFGTTSDDWREVNSGQDVGTYFIPGGNRAFVPGRITFFHRFSGPSISVDTACSSSFAALHVACQSLLQGGCDTAIVGGTNILTNPDNFAGLDRGHFLSTTGNCNPFDDDASGYCRADAVASLVLKRLEHAEADHDPIFGIIRGVDTNHCGQTVSITRPHQGDQLALFKRILRNTNTNPLDVNYVEMHGTGTQAGDAAEMSSVLTAMAPDGRRTPKQALYLGALKANVGHSESASGVSALIKVLMMFQHDEIPPHIGIKNKINRHYPLDLRQRNVNIASSPTPWRRNDNAVGRRVSFLNNFSAAGGNTAVLLEDAPEYYPPSESTDPRPQQLISVTANSPKSFEGNLQALLKFLTQSPSTSLPALSYTTTARRLHYKFRALFAIEDVESLKKAIVRKLEDKGTFIPSAKGPLRIAFAFSGQGSLYTKLGRDLFQVVSSFRQDIVRFDRIVQQHGFPTVLPLITSDTLDIETVDTCIAHIGVVCVQMALHNLWVSWGIAPSLVIGHSLGEYPALYAAGVLSASDAIYLVGTRAQLVSAHSEKGTHCMLVAKASVATVQRVIPPSCEVACFNSPTNTTISGPTEDIKLAEEKLRAEKVRCIPLSLPYAFHSAQVDSWVKAYETIASSIEYRPPTLPYVSPLLSKVVIPEEIGVFNGSYLARASRNAVNFAGAITAAKNEGLLDDTTWIDIGTHPACSSFLKELLGPDITALASLQQSTSPWTTLIASIQALYLDGADICWGQYHKDFPDAQTVLPLPKYSWDLKNYWIDYRGNFCLTKGDVQPAVQSTIGVSPAATISSSVHRVVEEAHGIDKSELTTESDIHDHRLYPILRGHQVNDTILCPSSLYADMAFTIVRYMLQANGLSTDLGLDCADMKVDRPLIADPRLSSQLLRVSASAGWALGNVSLRFFSYDSASKPIYHATCTVKITQTPSQAWLLQWKRLSHLVQDRIASLRTNVDDGNAHRMQRSLAYKLFSSLVVYEERYQGMQEVILNSKALEATARVSFQVGDEGFFWNPCWIDSLGHIAGFVMNGNEYLTSSDFVFINHGWSNMRCASRIEHGKTYQTYNRMYAEDDKAIMYTGDTYILENDAVVAIFEGVRFQRVPRSVLDRLKVSKQQTIPKRAPIDTKAPKEAMIRPRPVNEQPKPLTAQDSHLHHLKIVISEETGIDLNELDVGTPLGDLGIDSLLSLTISGRLQDDFGINLPSSLFAESPTLAEIVTHLSPPGSLTPSTSSTSLQSSVGQGGEQDDTETSSVSTTDMTEEIRGIIAQEIGVPVEDIEPNMDLSELGMDSLMSLSITDKVNELGVKLPQSLFSESPTLNGIMDAISPNISPNIVTESAPQATSVRIQGSSSNPKATLFLLPDGAGVATSYTSLLPISPSTVVYGLNCPFLKTPHLLRGTLQQYVTSFVAEIRRRQPTGPYHLGGWSAGGILAYEAAQQLASTGQTTATLILLDTPDPIGIQSPPQRMYDFLESIDVFGLQGRKTPSWLRPHFAAFIDMLDRYRPVTFTGKVPATHIVYARDGICKEGDPRPEERHDDPREMTWLINERTDFSGGGWRGLIGEQKLNVRVVDGVNHYSMMAGVEKVSSVVAEALGV